ncbi:MAG: S-layer homology domain-containing protein [Chloroflexi bacterium]|nr:S-layer homology domain-containing protein [Chloroflexota bacterium]
MNGISYFKGLRPLFAIALALALVLAEPLAANAAMQTTGKTPASPFPIDSLQKADKLASRSFMPSAVDGLGSSGSGFVPAADWLLGQQDVSGGFPWTPGGTVTVNTQGPSARGLLKAYEHTGNTLYLDGAGENGDFLVTSYPRTYTDGDPRFATHDPLFLEQLGQVTGDTAYAGFVQTNFWDKLTAGTYGEANDMDAADFGDYVVDGRTSQGIVELSPWDLSATAIAAHVAGETASRDALMSKILRGLNETTSAYNTYDVIGLAGAVWASAVTGVELDPTAGVYASANSNADLVAILLTMRTTDGAWKWSTTLTSDPANADTQTTAFAILALNAYSRATYLTDIARGAAYIRGVQDVSGQFLLYPGDTPGSDGSVETHAEALTALVEVAPDTTYVDDDWLGSAPGADPDGGGPAIAYGFDAFATIGEAIDGVSNSTVNVAAGTYNETVTFNDNTPDNLTIHGIDPGNRPEITGGLLFDNDTNALDGLSLENLVLKGDADTNATNQAIVVMRNDAAVNDFSIDNCVLDGENFAPGDGEDGRHGFVGNKIGGSFSVTNSEFKNILGWALLDMDSSSDYTPIGGNGLALNNITFSNNNIHDNNGSVSLRGNHTTRTTQVDVIGNTWSSIGGAGGYTGYHWAALEVNNAVQVNVHNNTISNVNQGGYGEGEAIQFWNVETLDVSGNTITNNYQGIYFYSDGVDGTFCGSYGCPVPGGSITSNKIEGNTDFGVKVEAVASGGPLDAENNWWGAASGPTHASNLIGTGDAVSDNVDFTPWCGDVACTSSYPPFPTTTTITADIPDPSILNQTVSVNVTVASDFGTPTGSVDITGADTDCTITLASGSGSCDATFTTSGTKTLTATYTGNATFADSLDIESHTVNLPIPEKPTLISPEGNIGNIHNPTYTWNAVSNAEHYTLAVNGPTGVTLIRESFAPADVCNGSVCSLTHPLTLSNGPHTWWVRAWNSTGYGKWSNPMYFSVAPDTTITSNPPNPSTSANATFSFTSNDPAATFECQLDSGSYSACTSSKSYTGLSESSHTFNVRAVESYGTPDPTPASYTWTIDFPTCYALTLSHTGQGSNPVASPTNSTDCAVGQYIAGATINLSGAIPNSGWQISGWTGTNNNASTLSTNTVTMPASTHTAGVTYAVMPNQPPIITEGASIGVTMSENGSPVPFSLTLHATDPDSGDTLTWSVSIPATHGTASAYGTGTSKIISYVPTLNYNGSDSFTVQVSDGNGGIDTIAVNVTINAVNNPPTDIILSNSGIDENQAAGSVVGIFSTTDPDVGDSFTYTFCGGSNTAYFTIVNNSLQSAVMFDYETKSSYSVCIHSTDSGALNTTKIFTININNLLDTATFADVPTTHWAWQWIERLYNAGITGGCSTNPFNYCPEDNVTRAQIAVFLEKGLKGSTFNPPVVPITFTDTPGHWAQYWIEALKADGITSGCGLGIYCPEASVTRAEMAVFLLKSKHGASYLPPLATGTMFSDVPADHWAASWIEQLASEGITSGCGAGIYCPDSPVTRAQIAVFLVKTFNLP